VSSRFWWWVTLKEIDQ